MQQMGVITDQISFCSMISGHNHIKKHIYNMQSMNFSATKPVEYLTDGVQHCVDGMAFNHKFS